jgi:glycosyltransferase involved in cell wall biosynthesis
MRKIKVAVSQRIIPHYRIPVFKELASREDIDLTVFYGKGFSTGSQVNGKNISGFKAIMLATVFLNYKGVYGSAQLRVWHPGLLFHLIRGRFDVVIAEPSTNFYNDIFIYLYCKLFQKKFIWYEAGSVPKVQRPLFRKLIDPLVSTFIKNADAYITYTSFADNSLLRDFPEINPKSIFRAQNTVDTSNIPGEIITFMPKVEEKKKEFGLAGNKVAMYIGGIEQRKKINNLITAVANLNSKGIPSKTLIVGDGPDKELVIEKMTEKERNLTIFAGKHIIDATLYVLLSDVVVLPSSGGLSIIQAFACGKPFIGSEEIEYGGIKDYVTNGMNGYLVKENDVEDLHKALELTFSDENKYIELCTNAFKKSKDLTISKMVDGMEKAIKYSLRNENSSNQ